MTKAIPKTLQPENLETNKYKPVIDRQYKLEQIVEAYKYVESGQKTGNVIIKIA